MTLSCWAIETVEAAKERFDIVRFEVEGNTLFSPQTIDNLLAPFLGHARNFGTVQKASVALEDAYHKRGFDVVQVVLPEQELNNGVVRLKVVEVHISKVTVQGNKIFDNANIRRSLPGLREGEPPNVHDISASLKLANENPSKKIVLNLQSADKEGEVNAIVNVTDEKDWNLGLNVDNSGNAQTGATHVGVTYKKTNMWGLDHVASLQYTTSAEKPGKIHIYGVGYHIPLYSLTDSIDFFGSYSDVDSGNVSAGLLNLQVSGRGTVFGLRYNHNLPRLKNLDASLLYGIDYRAYKNDVQLTGIQLGKDVTVHPLNFTFASVWTLPSAQANFSATGIQNFQGGIHGSAADFNHARMGASANYSLLRFGAAYYRMLAADWQMRLNVNGQFTNDRLIPGEQFGAGGAGSVRGFLERELSDDSGILANAEIYTPNFCSHIGIASTQCRMLAFFDTAKASRNAPLAGEELRWSISSAGLGFRMTMNKYLSVQLDYGQVIDAGGSRHGGDRRLHLSAGLVY